MYILYTHLAVDRGTVQKAKQTLLDDRDHLFKRFADIFATGDGCYVKARPPGANSRRHCKVSTINSMLAVVVVTSSKLDVDWLVFTCSEQPSAYSLSKCGRSTSCKAALLIDGELQALLLSSNVLSASRKASQCSQYARPFWRDRF